MSKKGKGPVAQSKVAPQAEAVAAPTEAVAAPTEAVAAPTEAVAPQAEAAAPQAEAAPAEQFILTVDDLKTLGNIIDVASKRGAFHANELEVVGKAYTRLTTFLDVLAKTQAAAKEQEANNQ